MTVWRTRIGSSCRFHIYQLQITAMEVGHISRRTYLEQRQSSALFEFYIIPEYIRRSRDGRVHRHTALASRVDVRLYTCSSYDSAVVTKKSEKRSTGSNSHIHFRHFDTKVNPPRPSYSLYRLMCALSAIILLLCCY